MFFIYSVVRFPSNVPVVSIQTPDKSNFPQAIEASREVANLTWKKNPQTSYMVSKNLSVCLSVTYFDLQYLRTGEIEWAEIVLGISLSKVWMLSEYPTASG